LRFEVDIKSERANAKKYPQWHAQFKKDRSKMSFKWPLLSKVHKRKKLNVTPIREKGSKFAVPDT
jgi:hypothetical protein